MSVEPPVSAGDQSPPPPLLRRIRAAVAASALLTAGFGLVILVEEPRHVVVVVISAATAGVYVLALLALSVGSRARALVALEGLGGAGLVFSALLFVYLALVEGIWLDGVTLWVFVFGVVQGLLVWWSRQALASLGVKRGALAVGGRALLIVVGILGFVSLLIPDHVHPPNYESWTLGDIRTMVSAQATYQTANGGFYDVPECLATPHRCIPGYPADAPTFIDSQLGQTSAIKGGYRRVFHPGRPADSEAIRRTGASASSLMSYAYVAIPLEPGKTGIRRGFCADGSGVICSTPDGHAPAIENGSCALPCEFVQ